MDSSEKKKLWYLFKNYPQVCYPLKQFCHDERSLESAFVQGLWGLATLFEEEKQRGDAAVKETKAAKAKRVAGVEKAAAALMQDSLLK